MNAVAVRRRDQRLHVGAGTFPTVLGAIAIVLIAFVEGVVWPRLIGCVLLAMVATSLLAVVRPPRVRVWAQMPRRITVGAPFDTTLHIVTEGKVRRRTIKVTHRFEGTRRIAPDGTVLADTSAKHIAIRLTRTPILRGVTTHSVLDIVVAGPFGFFSSHSSHRVADVVLSLPAKAAPLELRTREVALGRVSTEPRNVRDWRAGDSARDVHWRSSIRTGRLAVVEREHDNVGGFVVMVMAASGARGKSTDKSFERAISVAAATAVSKAQRGESVCVLTPGTGDDNVVHSTDPRALLGHFARATTTEGPSDDLLQYAATHAARGGVVLLVADSSTPSAWKSRLLARSTASGARIIDVRELLRSETNAISSA